MEHEDDNEAGQLPASTTTSVAVPDGGASAIAEQVSAAVRQEFDQVLPHVVSALKGNDAVAALASRLEAAERRLAERDVRPMVAGIRRVLRMARRLSYEPEVKAALVADLEALLVGAGYTEFGEVGEPFVPGRHTALEGEVAGGRAVVAEIFERGLETLGEVIVPAQVRVDSAHDLDEAPT